MLWKQSTNIKWYVVRPFISSNCDDLGCMSRSFIDCILFFLSDKRVSQSSAIAELLVHNIRSLRTSGRRDRMSVVCVCVCVSVPSSAWRKASGSDCESRDFVSRNSESRDCEPSSSRVTLTMTSLTLVQLFTSNINCTHHNTTHLLSRHLDNTIKVKMRGKA